MAISKDKSIVMQSGGFVFNSLWREGELVEATITRAGQPSAWLFYTQDESKLADFLATCNQFHAAIDDQVANELAVALNGDNGYLVSLVTSPFRCVIAEHAAMGEVLRKGAKVAYATGFYFSAPTEALILDSIAAMTEHLPYDCLMPCGLRIAFDSAEQANRFIKPMRDVPCPCGDPSHWLVKFEIDPALDKRISKATK